MRSSLRPARWGNAYSGGLTGWLSRLEEDQISGGPALLPHPHPIPQGALLLRLPRTLPSPLRLFELHPSKLLFHPSRPLSSPIRCGVSFFSHWGPLHTTLRFLAKAILQVPPSGTGQGSPGCTKWDNGTWAPLPSPSYCKDPLPCGHLQSYGQAALRWKLSKIILPLPAPVKWSGRRWVCAKLPQTTSPEFAQRSKEQRQNSLDQQEGFWRKGEMGRTRGCLGDTSSCFLEGHPLWACLHTLVSSGL